MKQFIAMLLCTVIPSVGFAVTDSGFKVAYDGGSIANVKAGNGIKLYVEQSQIRFVKDKQDLVTIPASSVTEVSYGLDVHRRVGAAIGLAVVSFGIGALMA